MVSKDTGRVVAAGYDFAESHPAGFDVDEAQRIRAANMMAREFIEAFAAPALSACIDSYTQDQIMRQATDRKGRFEIATVAIGHEEGGHRTFDVYCKAPCVDLANDA